MSMHELHLTKAAFKWVWYTGASNIWAFRGTTERLRRSWTCHVLFGRQTTVSCPHSMLSTAATCCSDRTVLPCFKRNRENVIRSDISEDWHSFTGTRKIHSQNRNIVSVSIMAGVVTVGGCLITDRGLPISHPFRWFQGTNAVENDGKDTQRIQYRFGP